MKNYLLTAIALFVMLPLFAASEVRADNPAEVPKSGWVTENKQTYYYKEGKAVKGWQKIKKKWYFFNKKTKVLAKNTIAGDKSGGYYYVDQDGVRCKDKTMKLAVAFVRKHSKAKDDPEKRLYSCFTYFVKKFRYRSGGLKVSAKDLPAYAKEFLGQKQGNCYRGAAALAYCAKALGFSARIGVGGKTKKQGRGLKPLPCQHFIGLEIFVDGLVHDLLRKLPVVSLVRLQPVSCELLVEGALAAAGLIFVCRPESGTVGRQHFVADHELSVLIQTEFKLGVCNDDAAA